MSRLPHLESAIFDERKLEDYCLNAEHPRGRHKARVFREALGIEKAEANWLRNALLAGLQVSEAIALETDAFGTRWRCDLQVARQNRQAVVRTIWIVRTGETRPRFVTCWVL
jgi:hypothetical protein